MRVVHEPAGDGRGAESRVLATEVERPGSALANAKGLRFRAEFPEGHAYVMDVGRSNSLPGVGGARRTVVDMLFVRVPLDVVWVVGEEVVGVDRLRPWRGVAAGKADTIVELPAGAAEDVTVGDTVQVVDGERGRHDGA